MDRTVLLETVRRIALEHVRGTDVRVYLFGSWARGEERRSSDIDIGLWSSRPLSREWIASLRERFEESTVPRRVDVVDLTQVDPAFVQRVLKEGIQWSDSEIASKPPSGG
ncbi:nucleotidyltransferase family protein [Kyrpidia tusciae]|uniref:DNA polymerase beta domain protein region n=1 Tax=Kyrpidia tusciae (strain DSM 2912 / NBRC 15312 / T2) TaxID=562970 RepID=D5WWJ7_KYRT2|nr:nucleotidyltransferase domain-containing protein [Kyrpidia tusciae]ADG07762.1 DNA polymerase beta domain protein region [Kyrpidia tusciae DSM 2912]